VHRADVRAQHVDRGEHDAAEGDAREDDLRPEDAEQDVELADEVRAPGDGEGPHRDDEEQRGQHRRAEGDAAHVADVLAAAGARGEQHHDEQERRHDEAVVDHLDERALGALGAQREDAERDEAELRDRRVARDPPHLRGGEGHGAAVQDRGEGDAQQQRLIARRGLREELQPDAQEPVGADLREHGAEDHQRLDRHRPVGVGHPAVDREGRHLHQEGGGEEEEDPVLRASREQVRVQVAEREGDRPAVGRGEHAGGDRRGEHEQRADERVDDELDRRPHAVGTGTPQRGEEDERDEHEVEEGDEEREVLREERAEDRALGEAHPEEEGARAAPVAEARGEDRGGADDRREDEQHDVEPVDAELVMDAERADPHVVGDVLQPVLGALVVDEQPDRDAQRAERPQERDLPDEPAREQRRDERDGERQAEEDGEDHDWSKR
jgi:hypothetical protein